MWCNVCATGEIAPDCGCHLPVLYARWQHVATLGYWRTHVKIPSFLNYGRQLCTKCSSAWTRNQICARDQLPIRKRESVRPGMASCAPGRSQLCQTALFSIIFRANGCNGLTRWLRYYFSYMFAAGLRGGELTYAYSDPIAASGSEQLNRLQSCCRCCCCARKCVQTAGCRCSKRFLASGYRIARVVLHAGLIAEQLRLLLER